MSGWPKWFEDVLSSYLPDGAGSGSPWRPDSSLRDRGIDSVSVVGLMTDLEIELGIVFPEDRMTMETFRTAGSLWAVVAELTGAGAGGAA